MKKIPKVLLLENIHSLARDYFTQHGFIVETLKSALGEDELITKVKDFDVLGIRSKTMVTKKVIEQSRHLLSIGCFCVGTNQVDLDVAKKFGMPVFNAPFSNTRSVAEMVISNVIALARQIGQRNIEMHEGLWNKTSSNCYEVRGKTLGIVGYGNIGTQVSMIAENLGMRVVYYDVVAKLALGNAKPHATLQELLADSDFVTLHVPSTSITKDMIGAEELSQMRKGAFLLNASRGNVIDIQAFADAIKSGHLAGGAIDVFPEEPEKTTSPGFKTPLQGIPNVILTPHIGGATEEAQHNIGREVAGTLVEYVKNGSTLRAVNFPHLDMPKTDGAYRLLNVHQNVPGVLKDINRIIGETGANIITQSLSTDPQIGYLLMDVDHPISSSVSQAIDKLGTSIRSRIVV